MSEGGPTTELPHDFYGRQVKLEVQTSPQKAWGVGLFLIALAAMTGLLGMSTDDPRAFIMMICGALLFPVGLFMIYGAIQITKMPAMHLRVGLETLRFPRGKLLWRSEEEEVNLLRIANVALMTQNGQMFLRLTLPDGSTQIIQQAWLPPEWSAMDFYVLLQMRIRAARAQLDRVQQVAAEAQVFADQKDVLGVVVDTRGKRPKAYALVHDIEDYETLLARDDFPHTEHQLVVPSDRVESVRSGVEEGMLSALEIELEKRS